MPLVTRQANQGNLFKQDLEPPDWVAGDLWSDTTADKLQLNVAGTATDIGLDVASESATKGDTIIFDGTDWARLAIGADNEIYKVATDLPNWEAEPPGTGSGFSILGGGLGSFSTNAAFFYTWNGLFDAVSGTTESVIESAIIDAYIIKQVTAIAQVNTKNVASVIGARDDGVTVASVSVTASTTGVFEGGEVTVTVAAGSDHCGTVDTSASASGNLAWIISVEVTT